MSTVTFTDYHDFPIIKVGPWLVSKGFTLASKDGYATITKNLSPEMSQIGLLLPGPKTFETKKHWFKPDELVETTRRKKWVGVVSFKGSHWSINVYGEENATQLKKIAEEMASAFAVDIDVMLVKKYHMDECFSTGCCA